MDTEMNRFWSSGRKSASRSFGLWRLRIPLCVLMRRRESKINRLLDEIDAMRVDISQRQKRVNEKDKEVRHLARDQPFFLG